MNLFSRIGAFLADDRLLYNLIAVHALLGAALLLSFILRRLLTQGSNRLSNLASIPWLRGLGQEAARGARTCLFWTTLIVMGLIVAVAVIYHLGGRDIRTDLAYWYTHLTLKEVFDIGLVLGELGLLRLGCWFGARQLRRFLPRFHETATRWLGHKKEDALQRWFVLLERYAITMMLLAALWCAGQIVGLVHFADTVLGFIFRIVTILSVAHLLILSCRTLSHLLSTWGNNHLSNGQFHRYWERITRLFPFGERCFEAAVYVTAASLCVKEFKFIAVIADYGPKIVQCIGLFFGTRVII